MSFFLKSTAFAQGARIPAQYTSSGRNISPPFSWQGAPPGTKSYVIICDDPDAPAGVWVHSAIYNIPASTTGLRENISPIPRLADGTLQGKNDFMKIGYGGPSPPPGKPHRYFFKLFALDTYLDDEPGHTKKAVLDLMRSHILAKAEYYGTFSR